MKRPPFILYHVTSLLVGQFAIQNHKTESIETSVHSGENVKQAFHKLAEHLIFSHGIFQPGREVCYLLSMPCCYLVNCPVQAAVGEDSCGTMYRTMAPRKTDSIRLEEPSKIKEHSDQKKCCLSS